MDAQNSIHNGRRVRAGVPCAGALMRCLWLYNSARKRGPLPVVRVNNNHHSGGRSLADNHGSAPALQKPPAGPARGLLYRLDIDDSEALNLPPPLQRYVIFDPVD